MTGAIALPDEAATARLGEDIAAVLRPGDLVALSGGLGAGKTALARAMLRALAADPGLEVASPTFPIRIDYPLPRLTVVHADLYRMTSASELDEIGLEDALDTGALIVEWPELLPGSLAANRLDVRLTLSGQGRTAELNRGGSWPERLARTQAIRAFLDEAGWAGANRIPLAGDASSRAYERITRRPSPPLRGRDGEGGQGPVTTLHASPLPSPPPQEGREDHAILMNAPARAEGPPVQDGRPYDSLAKRALDVRPFVAIGRALRDYSFRAPDVFAADIPAGLLLTEDLGAEGIVDAGGAPIMERYAAAIDLLAAMHAETWPERIALADGSDYRIPPYDEEALLVEVSLFPDWFGAANEGPRFPAEQRAAFLSAWRQALGALGGERTIVLRDFHSPNIIWQRNATGTDRVSLIDFQDALLGHPAYDVASLAQDARVDLSEAQEAALKARYVAARRADPGFDAEGFEAAYAVLAAQRATKVLGAFTRLALVEGKPGYQRHRERLKSLLRRTLRHPVLESLRVWYEPYV